MSKKRRDKKMSMLMPQKDYSSTEVGWRRLKQIAEKSMDKHKYMIDDVKKVLNKFRSTYKK